MPSEAEAIVGPEDTGEKFRASDARRPAGAVILDILRLRLPLLRVADRHDEDLRFRSELAR
jgi:hypothetical protein